MVSALCALLFVSLNYVLFIMACWPVTIKKKRKKLYGWQMICMVGKWSVQHDMQASDLYGRHNNYLYGWQIFRRCVAMATPVD